jgi:hypothetical protein
MSTYRYYRITNAGHIVEPGADHEAASDLEAVRKGQQIADGRDLEIWNRERLVTYLVPDTKKWSGL